MIRKYTCNTKDFSFTYAGHYAEGGPGAIVNVNISGPTTSFEIRDGTAMKIMEVKRKTRLQNVPEKK